MNAKMKMAALVAGNFLCWAIALAIISYAFRTWPERYTSHTLSWSVTGFFVVFIALSIVGLVATAVHLRGRGGELMVRLASAPVALLVVGFVIGVTKAALTGDF